MIPGHEAVGTVVDMGANVKGFEKGDRCVADVGITVRLFVLTTRVRIYSLTLNPFPIQCDNCFYCRRGQPLLCENFNSRGVTQDGGFADYIA